MSSVPIDAIAKDPVRRDQWGRYMVVSPGEAMPRGYTRVTTIAKTLDPGGGLAPWKAAMTATGIIMRRGLRAQWEALIAEHGDPWYATPESKAAAKQLVEECAAVGGANDRKEIGTAFHAIAALSDKGLPTTHLTEETEADLRAYRTGLALSGIDVDPDLVELMVVLDDWHVAGTLDRIVTVPGFDLPLIADLKTGADLTYSWHSIAVQLAAYAQADNIYQQGRAQDGSQDVRLPMPEVNQQWGLVIWVNAGSGELDLFLVDLAAGWDAFNESVWARGWRNRKDLAVPLSEFNYDLDASADPDEKLTKQLEESVKAIVRDGGQQSVRDWLQVRIDAIGQHEQAKVMLRDHWPANLPTLRSSDEHTTEQLVSIETLLDAVERANDLGFPLPKPD